MFSTYEGGGHKPREMFGTNNTIPGEITVNGVTKHVMSTTIAQEGTAAGYSAVGNKHDPTGLSARMEASQVATNDALMEAQAASLEATNNGNNDDADEFGVPVSPLPTPGLMQDGVTPEQLRMIKKNTPRGISHPGVTPTYRPGDPRSPEMRKIKAENERTQAVKVRRLG